MVRVHVYTGEGEGKTLAALGLAMRAIGHEQRVVMVQFMKGRKEIGEYKIKDKLCPKFEVYQFGRKGFVDTKKPTEADKKKAIEGLKFIRKMLKENVDMLILDEINLAASIGLVKSNDVIEIIKTAPKKMLIVLTGRKAPKIFKDIADLVTVMKEVKHPYNKGIKAKKGIEY